MPSPSEADAGVRRELEVLALVRTSFSSERSLMAWLRTSVSLYAFGFSLTKFFDYVAEGMEDQTWTGPERLGLALLGLGMLVLILGAIQHRRRVRRMKQLGLPVLSRFSLPIGAAAALLAIGLTTLLGTAFP